MELDLSKNITNNTKDEEISEFMKELKEKLEDPKIQREREIADRKCRDEENFATELANELGISDNDLKLLRKKIDDYLKEYSKYCGEISYQGYDIDSGKYYVDWYKNGKRKRDEYTYHEFAIMYTMGWFYKSIPPSNNSAFLFNEIKDAIKFSIQEQLVKGIEFKDINLLKLENGIKNNKYFKPLYDEYK